MLEYDRIDISEALIQIKQVHQKSVILPLLVFSDKNFNYEPYLCNRCRDLMQKATSFKQFAIVSIKENDYRIHFWYMSKNDAIVLMTNSNLNDKNGILIKFFHHI